MKYNVGTMKYFLVGYMACGKTRRGKVIAEEPGVRFIDLDAYIVERENRSISEIFAAIGEAGFRRLETFYLKEVCELYQDFVLSTGGGYGVYECAGNHLVSEYGYGYDRRTADSGKT